jgi:hypothetical protein
MITSYLLAMMLYDSYKKTKKSLLLKFSFQQQLENENQNLIKFRDVVNAMMQEQKKGTKVN